jgi:hypothetical protein|tara:strand:- start:3941 stop:4516 length:576 start_codon:yes stop_codon:yes gene_type:complete
MMFMTAFHHLVVGLVAGSGVMMGICAILVWLSSYISNLESSKLTLDRAAYVASIFTMIVIPLAMISGNYSSTNSGGAIFYNKFLFSGIAFGFSASYFVGRVRFGPEVWDHSSLSNLQMISASFALTSIIILGSIGSKITLGESTLDIFPFWPDFMNSIVINQWFSILLVIFGLISVVISLRSSSIKVSFND